MPYTVGFICVLVQSTSWGDALHHELNKMSSPCSELLAGEKVIRSDAKPHYPDADLGGLVVVPAATLTLVYM